MSFSSTQFYSLCSEIFALGNPIVVLLTAVALWTLFFRFLLPALLGMLKLAVAGVAIYCLATYGGTMWQYFETGEGRDEAKAALITLATNVGTEISSYEVRLDIEKK